MISPSIQLEPAFQNQTALPVHRVGIPGYWSLTGGWGASNVGAIGPDDTVFAVRAIDLRQRRSFIIACDWSGQEILRAASSVDATHAFHLYHRGCVHWENARQLSAMGVQGEIDLQAGMPIEPSADHHAMLKLPIIGSTQIKHIDPGCYEQVPPPDQFGIFRKTEGGRRQLVYSVARLLDMRRREYPHLPPFPDTPVDCCAPKWSYDRRWFLFELGNHEATRLAPDNPPRINELWVATPDLKTIFPAIPFTGDDQSFLNHGNFSDAMPDLICGATQTGVRIVSLSTSYDVHIRFGERWFAGGGGHPSMNQDASWLIYDTYNETGQLLAAHIPTQTTFHLLDVPRIASCVPHWWQDQHANHGQGPAEVDLHPSWSRSGRFVTFSGMEGELSQVYVIDLHHLLDRCN